MFDLKIGDQVRRNPDLPNKGKGFGLSPMRKDLENGYWEEIGKVIDFETAYNSLSIYAVRVKWDGGATFRYDKSEALILVIQDYPLPKHLNPKVWLEDELFEI